MKIEPLLAPRAASILYGLAKAQLDEGESRWLLPANICTVVPLALLAAGASLEFVDMDMKSWCMDTRHAAARLADCSRPITAILYVRTYGISEPAAADLRALRAAAPHGTLLIDDRCCDIPVLNADGLGPKLADVVLFSTGKGKIADLDGGGFAFFADAPPCALFTGPADPSLVAPLARLCDRGGVDGTIEDRQRIVENPTWLGGAGPESWPHYRKAIAQRLETVLPHKAHLNAAYQDMLGFLQPRADGQIWRFNIEVADRDALLAEIFAAGLFASAHYAPSAARFGGGYHENAQRLADRILNLFNGPEFDIALAEVLVGIIVGHGDTRMQDYLRGDRE